MKKILLLLTILTLLGGSLAPVEQPALPDPGISARSAIVMDADTGAVLFEREADRRSLIASTTKIMTGLLICRDLDPEETVPVPEQAVGVEGSSMYLEAGEKLTVRELLLGMMLLVASLDVCGFFDITAGLLMRCSVSGRTLLGSVMILSAVLSALVLNDAVVLLMTPAVIRCCQKAGCDPIPYLIAVFVSANIGSVATAYF